MHNIVSNNCHYLQTPIVHFLRVCLKTKLIIGNASCVLISSPSLSFYTTFLNVDGRHRRMFFSYLLCRAFGFKGLTVHSSPVVCG